MIAVQKLIPEEVYQPKKEEPPKIIIQAPPKPETKEASSITDSNNEDGKLN